MRGCPADGSQWPPSSLSDTRKAAAAGPAAADFPGKTSPGDKRRYRGAVDLGGGWDLTPEQQGQLHVLDWLYDRADGRADMAVTLAPTDIAAPGGCDQPVPLQDTLGQLYRDRLIWYWLRPDETAGMPGRAMLTDNGVQVMRQIRKRRGDPAARRVAVRDAVLRWAYKRAATGQESVAASCFVRSRYARFLSTRGDLFSHAEIGGAVDWLARHGYLHAVSSGGDTIVAITEEGEHTVETGRSVRDHPPAPPAATSITITSSRNVNIAAHSPGASQENTVIAAEETQQLLTNLADYLQQHSAELAVSADGPRRTAQVVVELRLAAAQPTHDPGGVRKALDTVRQIAIGAASVPAGAGLLDLLEKAVHALGL